jgi:hypothetical protein
MLKSLAISTTSLFLGFYSFHKINKTDFVIKTLETHTKSLIISSKTPIYIHRINSNHLSKYEYISQKPKIKNLIPFNQDLENYKVTNNSVICYIYPCHNNKPDYRGENMELIISTTNIPILRNIFKKKYYYYF